MPSPFRPSPGIRLPLIPASLAAVLLLAASAHAWPFVERDSGGGTFAQSLDQPLALQLDADRPLEIFTGGPEFLQMAANPSGLLDADYVGLPLPDFDPYSNGLPQVRFDIGQGTAGDIDGDGDIDIIYSATLSFNGSYESGNVRVVACRNNGDGTWTRLWQIKTTSGLDGGSPAVRLADLDRDGDLDFIESSTGVRVRWNDGTGSYSSSTILTTIPEDVPQIEVADFDGNGWPDVAVFGDVAGLVSGSPLALTGRLTLFPNEAGVFTAQVIHTVEPATTFYGSGQADLDGDGRTDLLAVRERFAGGSDLFWFRNTGSGFAAPVVLISNSTQGSGELRFHPGDLDEDGLIDLVISTKPNEVRWLRGTGGGAFEPPATLRASNQTGTGSALCVDDLDGDGDLDILLNSGNLWLENRSIRMQPAATTAAWSGINPSGSVDLTVGDVNNDGKDDLVVADGGATRIRWYAGTGSGLAVPSFISTGNLQPLSVAAGDFNGDGWTDLAWTTTDTLRQAISSNSSGLGWIFTAAANMTGITDIVPEDTDRDGDTDIVSISPPSQLIRIHRNNGDASGWLPQNVDTGIASLKKLATGQSVPGGPPEVLTLSSGIVNRHRYLGTAWSYNTIANSAGGAGSAAIAVADIADNLPGPEIIYSLNSNTIYYDHDNLNQPVLIVNNTGAPVTELAAVDWNRDGFTDILAATTSGLLIYLNNRSSIPAFNADEVLLSGTSIQDLVVMRLDGDAYPDAVVSQTGTGQLHLISNQTAAVEVIASGQSPRLMFAGATDVATTLNCRHRGMRSQEAPCAPANILIRFLRSSVVGGLDSPGTALTQAEVSALVEHVVLRNNGADYQATSPTGVSSGIFNLPINNTTRNALSIANKASRLIELRVKLKATAGSSAVQRFYVEYSNTPSQWVELDGLGNSNPLVLRKRGTTDIQRTLFVVDTPGALENWRMTWFGQYDGSGTAANDHDADGDGLPNLVEYVASRNPTAATGLSELSKPLVMVNGGPGDATIVEVRVLQNFDPNVRVRLQDTTGLQFWSNMSTRDGAGSWVGTTPTTSLLSGGRALYKFNTAISPNSEPKYFLRLVVDETP